MYSSFANHFSHLSRYMLVFFILFIFLPYLAFTKGKSISFENILTNYIKAVCFIVLLSLLLIVTRVYELLTVLAVLIYAFLYWYRKQKKILSWEDFGHLIMIRIYNILDGLEHPEQNFSKWLHQKKDSVKRIILSNFTSLTNLGYMLLFIAVFLYSAFLRFYNTITHAAPAMSDAYVVIAWLKYIDRKILFHDGIYPQGFHMYLDYLHKFSAADPLYIVNYSGPLHGVFITLSLYFVVSRWTGRKGAGILSAVIYGILGMFLPLELIRQAATNSQEFAFIFVMPALYFFFCYIWNGSNEDLFSAAMATFLIGLVHPVAFSFVGIGMGLLVFLAAISGPFKNFKRIIKIIIIGLMSIVVMFLPIGLGLLMGKDFYGASAEFLVRTDTALALPLLNRLEYFTLAALAIIFVYQLIKLLRRKNTREVFAVRYLMLLGFASFWLYYYGGTFTNNVVIATRSRELWGLVMPVMLGTAWFCITDLISFLKYKVIEVLAGLSLLLYIFVFIHPEPVTPYKMEYDSSVEQYLRISTMLKPTEWLVVSQEEGYALVYGKGFHLMLGDFLKRYHPYRQELEGCPQDIFVYHEKKVFWPELESEVLDEEKYKRREAENQALEKWLETYANRYDNISTFYEDDNLRIVQIHQDFEREETLKKIWGE